MNKKLLLLAALVFSTSSYALMTPVDKIDCESYLSNHKDFYGMLKHRLKICNDVTPEGIGCLEALRDTELAEEADQEALDICATHSHDDVRKAYILSRNDVFKDVYRVDARDLLSLLDEYDKEEMQCAIVVGEDNSSNLDLPLVLNECRSTIKDLIAK